MILSFFFFNDTATTEIYTTEDTLSLHDALPTSATVRPGCTRRTRWARCRSTRSEEHTSELQSPSVISYAVFCLKKKKPKMSYRQNHSHSNNYQKDITIQNS